MGSYIIQAWRLFDIRVEHHSPHWHAAVVSGAMHFNVFTHHLIGDCRWYLGAAALRLYARFTIVFLPRLREATVHAPA